LSTQLSMADAWPAMDDCAREVRLLVGVVADSSRATRDRLVASMAACDAASLPGQSMHWAVAVLDDGRESVWRETAATVATSRFQRVQLLAVLPRGDTARMAKHVHRERLLNATHAGGIASLRSPYDGIWMLDADVALAGADLQALLRRWSCGGSCGEWARAAPLIAQPTIRPSTQLWALNHAHWNGSRLRAVHTRFIEQQAPLFDAPFLLWLHRQPLVRSIIRLQHTLGTSWGMDAVWCAAAAAHPLAQRSRGARRRVPCAVLTVPVVHEDARLVSHALEERQGMRLLRAAKLIPSRCSNVSCATHPWFFLPGGHLKALARRNPSLLGGWVSSGCLDGGALAASAVRARAWV
jgi:hypothetical protein